MLSHSKPQGLFPRRTLADDARDTARAMGPTVTDVITPIRAAARAEAAARNRSAVLKAAKAAFDALGFHGVGLREIAKDAGVSTGCVFSHWPDKRALYVDVYGHPPITPEEGRDLVRRCAELEALVAADAA